MFVYLITHFPLFDSNQNFFFLQVQMINKDTNLSQTLSSKKREINRIRFLSLTDPDHAKGYFRSACFPACGKRVLLFFLLNGKDEFCVMQRCLPKTAIMKCVVRYTTRYRNPLGQI
ncbi:hypothetical protein CEXT_123581 [Caerostris extrusa]|uniref:Uncharacterized protein n=1 Tax=Caerostris extrusa TaxID=172846 RepID=A0AAV4QFU1_CAEEX|nr:hypothetical protein CEXT_123581 [Caerostris extrusa]